MKKNDASSVDLRRLHCIIEKSLTDVMENSLFSTKSEMVNSVEAYMRLLKSQQGISDYSIDSCKQATWEDYYPDAQQRQLAQEASAKFGNTVQSSDQNKPENIKDYPYRLETFYSFRLKDLCIFSGEHYSSEQFWEHTTDVAELPEDLSKYDVEKAYTWKIDDPEGIVLMDVHVKPAVPVEFIAFNLEIKP